MSTSTPTVQVPVVGSYEIDPARSSIHFTTRHMFGLAGVKGSFAVTGGVIHVAEPVGASTLQATASSASFATGTAKRDEHVTSADFLDAEEHPEIAFRSTGVVQEAAGWLVRGILTVRGTDAPLDLTVTEVVSTATGLTMTATAKVDRYAHGITKAKGMAGRRLGLVLTATATRA